MKKINNAITTMVTEYTFEKVTINRFLKHIRKPAATAANAATLELKSSILNIAPMKDFIAISLAQPWFDIAPPRKNTTKAIAEDFNILRSYTPVVFDVVSLIFCGFGRLLILLNFIFLQNVQVMATPLAGASVDRGVDVVITGKHREQRC